MRLALAAIVVVVPVVAAALLFVRQSDLAKEKSVVAVEPVPDAMQHLHRGPWVPHQDSAPLLRREPYRQAP